MRVGSRAGRASSPVRFAFLRTFNGSVEPAELRSFRDELRVSREWVVQNLQALQKLFPSLDRHDRRLARALRQPLRTMDVEMERVARLLDALLVETPPPDDA